MTLDARLNELEKRYKANSKYLETNYEWLCDDYLKPIQAGRVLSEALEECCKKEPDGFGDFVAEEFESEGIKAGRKALQKAEEILK